MEVERMKKRIFSVIICAALIFSLGTSLVSAEAIEGDPAARALPGHLLEFFNHIGREPQLFDDVLDQIYFNRFGEGFSFMLRHSNELNETITYGDFNVELLTAVAVAGEERPSFSFNEVTEVFSEDWENSFREINTFIFLSIQDESGEINFSDGTAAFRINPWGNTQLLFYDEETGTAYFVAEVFTSTSMSEDDNISIDFEVDGIFSDIRNFSETIDLDLLDLLDNHEATTATEDSRMISGMSWNQDAEEILGERFTELVFDRGVDEISIETLTRDELNISLCQDRYISNVALKNGLLHLQINEQIIEGGAWPAERSSFLSLIDTRNDDHIQHTFSLFLEELDEEYNRVSDRRYEEQVYHFPDADTMNYLALNINGFYYYTIKPLNISASFDLPILFRHIAVEEGLETEILGDLFNIVDISIVPTGISFTIEGGLVLQDDCVDREPDCFENRFSPLEHVNITLIHDDGTEHEFYGNSGSWGAIMLGPMIDGEMDALEDLQVIVSGSAIDMDSLVAIRINGELMQLQ